MKPESTLRQLDIAFFQTAVRRAGFTLLPKGSDAERIRRVAEYLGASTPATKTWWYGQNAPRGASARALLAQLEALASPENL